MVLSVMNLHLKIINPIIIGSLKKFVDDLLNLEGEWHFWAIFFQRK